jgi:hypothetical protein
VIAQSPVPMYRPDRAVNLTQSANSRDCHADATVACVTPAPRQKPRHRFELYHRNR